MTNVGRIREDDTEIWAKYQWMIEQTEKPIEEAVGVTEEEIKSLSNWHDYQILTDTSVALDFEGIP